MLNIQARTMYRSNGLIDEFIMYGAAKDYSEFAETIQAVVNTGKSTCLKTDSDIQIEIMLDASKEKELFTSLQNQNNEYFSMQEWEKRDRLKIIGCMSSLNELHKFMLNVSASGSGYSYISEYSKTHSYSNYSPEWRLHVQNT